MSSKFMTSYGQLIRLSTKPIVAKELSQPKTQGFFFFAINAIEFLVCQPLGASIHGLSPAQAVPNKGGITKVTKITSAVG
jgi:hypothetical protein